MIQSSSFRLFISLLLLLQSAVVAKASILVVGSMNADTFLPVARLPTEGENILLVPGKQPVVDVPGGKGCTQAVAASKLVVGEKSAAVAFVGQFGNDTAADMLKATLQDHNIQLPEICLTHHKDLPSGRGYVFWTESGSVSAVVSGGSNQDGWEDWKEDKLSSQEMDSLFDGVQCILLQREIPEYVNLRIATEARKRGGITVLQDIGGEEREMTREMMAACDYLIPNESELRRLVKPYYSADEEEQVPLSSETVIEMAKQLQQQGANHVLVTRGSQGSTLITKDGQVLHQPAFFLEPDQVVDETGAGDCYRAAFAVALLEGQYSLQQCMELASAAGCCSVQTQGAVPSTPSRAQVEELYRTIRTRDAVLNIPRGDGQTTKAVVVPSSFTIRGGGGDARFPFLIGSRLNSMKDRPELWKEGPLNNARDFVKRQAKVKGLTCVDFVSRYGITCTNLVHATN